ncbi:hypothetical protein ANANG_G00309430 [Anguilla anguilla]|uniref:Uncharacterized protein n=1 Tax=Anguilla anguilla TaxID=7936 RepID=A0A9D3RHG9_ANGAN|nr:hypothetical protein ANANG_G00309430 [Anguilla anguilla]
MQEVPRWRRCGARLPTPPLTPHTHLPHPWGPPTLLRCGLGESNHQPLPPEDRSSPLRHGILRIYRSFFCALTQHNGQKLRKLKRGKQGLNP